MVLKFIYRSFIFLLPLLIFGGLIEWYLYRTGENISSEKVIELQINNPNIIYQRGLLSQQFNVYKYEGIKKFKPEILVIGSSRVMQFRSEFFFPLNNKFYNAGGIIQCSEDIQSISNIIIEEKLHPKVLIVGLDPWWFKKDYSPRKTWLSKKELKDDVFSFPARLSAAMKIINNFSSLSFALRNENYLGSRALTNREGFRKDGSLKIADNLINDFRQKPVFKDRESPPVIERIKKFKTLRFTPSEIDTSKFKQTIAALEKLSSSGIEVMIYLPPFSNESFNALEQSIELKNWWTFYKSEITNSCKEKFQVLNTSLCPQQIGLTDIYCLDGFHPSEILVGHQILLGLENISKESILQRVDKKHLGQILSEKNNLPICLRNIINE